MTSKLSTQRNKPQVVEVADLLSLDSWDFSATGTEGSTISTKNTGTEEDAGSNSSLQTAPSMEDRIKNSCNGKSSNIHVSVSGVIFAVDQEMFKRLERLPWNFREGGAAYFHLDTSPVLFEMILNFVMFGTLPDLHKLTLADIEELEPLAALLELRELQQHLEKKILLRRGSFRRRRQDKKNKVESKQQQTMTAKSKGAGRTGKNSSSSNNKNSTTAVRTMQAAIQNRRLTHQQRSKPSHAEICAMSSHLH